jgi:myo-inositol 2-dehydrogenase / D-chiro-inositol 1-dehydrogenase
MTPRLPKPRVGLIGCGDIASYAHLRLLRRLPGVVLVGVADPDPDARARAARLAHVPVHDRSESLLENDDVDAVVICAPTPLHAELAVAAATEGKHFYLEKPIATTATEANQVLDAVARAGVKAAIGFNRRLHPLYEHARRILGTGRIGPVRAVTMAFCEPKSAQTVPRWMLRRATGGGVLLDLASHHFDSLRWLLGDEIGDVRATLSSEESEHDEAAVQLWTEEGVTAQGFFSYRAGHADYLEFLGEVGTLRVDRHRSTLELRVPRRLGYGVTRAWIPPTPVVTIWRLQRPFRRVRELSFRRSLEAYVELVRGGRRRLATLQDGLRSLEVVLEAEASNAERRDAASSA